MPVNVSRYIIALGLLAAMEMSAHAGILTFNSLTPASNAATRSSWLTAIGIAAPENLVNFETGFFNNQNISGVPSLFPDGLVITDTSTTASALIRTGAFIGGSSPVGSFAVSQNERPYLELDFSANPVDYLAFQDIDHTGTTGIVTFVGGATAAIVPLETTGSGSNIAEFYGIFRNDMPRITRLQLDANGDGRWGIDNIEYGQVHNVPEPSTAVIFGLGIAGLFGGSWRRRS